MNNKKIKEKTILEKFKKESKLEFTILTLEEAKKAFPQYNSENPDFIIHLDNTYIGIDLFMLCLTKSPTSIQYGGKEYINHMQRQSEHPNKVSSIEELEEYIEKRKKNPEHYPLIMQDDFGSIINERLLQKIKKVKNYVTFKNWLLGYADEDFNMHMIKNIYADGIQQQVKLFIDNHINQSSAIERVILFEPDSPKEKIFECINNRITSQST